MKKTTESRYFDPGKSSAVFPGAPAGILFPDRSRACRVLSRLPEIGTLPLALAWPIRRALREDSLFGKMLGESGKTSIRAGFGMYYSQIEALTMGVLAGNAPFGITYSSPAPPLFATPFITASTGQDQVNPFPVKLATGMASIHHPNPNIDWQQYEPITGIPAYPTTNRIPYVEEYMLSFQRQIGATTVLSASYVGNEGHRSLVLVEANPGNPALCLSSTGLRPFPGRYL